jgi:hypothetical protein
MICYFKERVDHYLLLLRLFLRTDSWQHFKPCDVLLVRHDGDCGYTFHNKAYAQIIDSFGDVCTRHGLIVSSVAAGGGNLTGKRAYHSPVPYTRKKDIITQIIRKGVRLIKRQNIDIGHEKSNQVDQWYRILERSSPKCVICIQPNEYLCQAGKRKKIPVYDLQHGVICDEHDWYGEVYRKEIPINDLPDGFLCWDDQSVATLSKWACNKGIRVLKVGNPWFLRFAHVQPDDLLVNEALANCDMIVDNRPCILVSLRWGFSSDRMCNDVIVKALEEVILDTAELYNWIIRLHPITLRVGHKREKVLYYLNITFGAEKTKQWLMISEIPLPVVLSKADLHITYESSIVIEASWLGVRSGVLSERFGPDGECQTLFSYERSAGMADNLPQNPEVIKQWIIDTLAKSRGKSTLNDTRQNLDSFIDEIAGMKS